jgi:hypothetical protein
LRNQENGSAWVVLEKTRINSGYVDALPAQLVERGCAGDMVKFVVFEYAESHRDGVPIISTTIEKTRKLYHKFSDSVREVVLSEMVCLLWSKDYLNVSVGYDTSRSEV